MKKVNLGVQSYLFPMPVLVISTYDEMGIPNAMTAAWGSLSDANQIAIYIGNNHKTTANILARRAYTVGITDAEHVKEADYVGSVSGYSESDKVERAGFHTLSSDFVDAPLIDELPMSLECRLVSYDPETELALGEIVNISVAENILSEDGRIDPTKLQPISYDPVNKQYLTVGGPIFPRSPKRL